MSTQFLRKYVISSDFTELFFAKLLALMETLLQEFIQQRYLAYEVIRAAGVQGNAEMVHVLYWGPRALNEVSKEKVLQYVCQVSFIQAVQYLSGNLLVILNESRANYEYLLRSRYFLVSFLKIEPLI